MKKSRKSYTFFQKVSSIFLMLVLLWLTISTPFILATQQEMAKQQKAMSIDLPINGSDEDCPDSSDNNNIEEKVPVSGNSLSEEFLHDHHTNEEFSVKTSRNYGLVNSGTYIAFHGELHAPPPNAA